MDPGRPLDWRLVTASVRLPANEALAQFKTCNKLPQILARAEADAAGADEALLLNTDGFVVEASSSNLFWIDNNRVCTAALASGILAGVTRAVVTELSQGLGLTACETTVTPSRLQQAEGVFLSLSSVGIAQAAYLDGIPLRTSLMVEQLRVAYVALMSQESR
jgi:branched-subunit amino acid aminotransferase/4-amino-4-deoxychorismate lyase